MTSPRAPAPAGATPLHHEPLQADAKGSPQLVVERVRFQLRDAPFQAADMSANARTSSLLDMIDIDRAFRLKF